MPLLSPQIHSCCSWKHVRLYDRDYLFLFSRPNSATHPELHKVTNKNKNNKTVKLTVNFDSTYSRG